MILSKLTLSHSKLLVFIGTPRKCLGRSTRTKMFIRRFTQEKGPNERDSLTESQQGQTLKERAFGPPGPNAYSMGKGAVAGGGLVGLAALCYYGIGLGRDQNSALNKSKFWPTYVHDRIRTTYSYLGGSVIITALTAATVFHTPQLLYIFTRTGIWAAVATTATMIGTGYMAQTLPYEEGFDLKKFSWLAHCAMMGAIIAPMSFMGGPVIMRAALYTAGIVGGLSTVAVCAPSDKFLFLGGTLAIGLGLLVASSFASMWLPPTTAIGAGISSFTLYGGLLLFSGFLLYDTQRIITNAERHPLISPEKYDPIAAAVSVYMDIINIFVRLAVITSSEGGKHK